MAMDPSATDATSEMEGMDHGFDPSDDLERRNNRSETFRRQPKKTGDG
ncbi:MAG: hypothetical protein ACRD1G_06245 [Acidimicrobiales bacterium]